MIVFFDLFSCITGKVSIHLSLVDNVSAPISAFLQALYGVGESIKWKYGRFYDFIYCVVLRGISLVALMDFLSNCLSLCMLFAVNTDYVGLQDLLRAK